MFERLEFISDIKTLGQMPAFSMLEIRDEPMLFSCDLRTSRDLAGPIGNAFLDVVRDSGFFEYCPNDLHLVFDSRVTLTMPGMYPSIPGWHCDDFNRDISASRFAQPKLADRDKRIRHCMTIVGEGDKPISSTEFVITPSVVVDLDTENVWHSLDQHINCSKSDIQTRRINNLEVIYFSQDTIHRATPAINGGWRFFGRVSHTYRKPANELRKQVQVFVDINSNGW